MPTRRELAESLRELEPRRRRQVRQGAVPVDEPEARLQLAFHRHRRSPVGFALAVVPGLVGAFIGITLFANLFGREGESFPSVLNIVAFTVTYGVVTAVLTLHYARRGIRHAQVWLEDHGVPGDQPAADVDGPAVAEDD